MRHLDEYKRELAIGALAAIAIGALLIPTGDTGERLGTAILALGYAAAVLVLVQVPATRRFLNVFAAIGRMAFTNYVLQSLIFGFVFFGYGFGRFGQIGATQALVLGVAVYAAQMLLSAWWLDRFRFGPLEWLWRTMMYGQVQPMWRR